MPVPLSAPVTQPDVWLDAPPFLHIPRWALFIYHFFTSVVLSRFHPIFWRFGASLIVLLFVPIEWIRYR